MRLRRLVGGVIVVLVLVLLAIGWLGATGERIEQRYDDYPPGGEWS